MGEELNKVYDMYLVDNETGESFYMGMALDSVTINYGEGENKK